MSEIKHFEFNWGGRPLVVEIGEVAKQANGACMASYGGSTVITAAVSNNQASTQDFFPLMVLYTEKQYAAGKIPGGFLKREGRPSENETLTSRLIDRPLRPLFAEGFRNEVQVINTVVSFDKDCSPQMTAMFGSSLSLMISDIPFEGPIAGVNVGFIDGEYILNPTPEQLEVSLIDLTVAGTKQAINMVESGAKEVSEEDMYGALVFGHKAIQELCAFQEEIVKVLHKDKMEVSLFHQDPEIDKLCKEYAQASMVKAIRIEDKLERYEAIDKVTSDTLEYFDNLTNFVTEVAGIKMLDTVAKKEYMSQVNHSIEAMMHDEVRRLISVEKVRPDGRGTDEIRELTSRIDVLPRTHGSALFTRGQTQSLGVVTLGGLNEAKIMDGLDGREDRRFMLHYNFPQYSVGETGRYGTPGRREIGHGALARRALSYVLPTPEEFPYAIRCVSEILESNGSSSQASICSNCLALMAAGVPIKAPVAGIAMGLIMTGKDYTILTDIQGMEDHLGDMDFKVAGTTKGITALQMDIKIKGITYEILKESLAQAKQGRLDILSHMATVIAEPRKSLSKYAPKVLYTEIPVAKIKDVIGAGGKVINKIIEDNDNVKIDIEQTGKVYVMHMDIKYATSALEQIKLLTKEAIPGEIYEGTVTRVEAYGCFVKLWEGTEGLCHISRLDTKRVEKVEDLVKVGDTILVKVLEINDRGQIDLSRKHVLDPSLPLKEERPKRAYTGHSDHKGPRR